LLVCYLDDSGEAKEPVITCAGYLSLAENWKTFEQFGRKAFDQLGLRYLHAVDLHHRRGFFKDWNSQQTNEFARDLYRLLKPDVGMGFEFSVLKSRFNKVVRKGGGSAFGFCFKGILDRILKNDRVTTVLAEPEANLSFVVEAGHPNNAEVASVFDLLKKTTELPLGTIEFKNKESCIALNMADFMAYFCRRIRNRTVANMRNDDLKFFYDVVGNIPHYYFFATEFGVEANDVPRSVLTY
jgi:hypothetical protein